MFLAGWFSGIHTIALLVNLTICVLPFGMTVMQLAEAAGISRQWLNVLVSRGEVPGVTRSASGRLLLQPSPALEQWAKQKREHLNNQRGRRLLPYRKPRDSTASRPYFTTGELADACRCSRETIRAKAHKIPGAELVGMRYRFTDSKALRDWIERRKESASIQAKRLQFKRRLQAKKHRLNPTVRGFQRVYEAVLNLAFELKRYETTELFHDIYREEADFALEQLGQIFRFAKELQQIRGKLKTSPLLPLLANVRRANVHKSS
jgi:hypothetical protein